MELHNINFLSKPKINANELKYVLNSKKVYANLFEIKMKKEITLYQYPYTVNPSIGSTNILIRNKLFNRSNKKLKEIFGDFFISGDCLYSMKEIKESKTVTLSLYLKGKFDYIIEFNNFENKRIIGQNEILKDPLSKQFIEMIIKDILLSNPKLDFIKMFFSLNVIKKL